MAFAHLVSKTASKDSLRALIYSNIGSIEQKLPFTEDGWFRISGIADLCPREEVLASTLKVTRSRRIDVNLQMIFDHGTSIHWGLQNLIMPKTQALYGVWSCLACGTIQGKFGTTFETSEIYPRPSTCPCGIESPTFLFHELHLKHPDLKIMGHPDGFLKLKGYNGYGVVEFKTVGAASATIVKKSPLPGHVVQVQLYMFMTGLKWAKILYWEKAKDNLNGLHEYTIEYDQDLIDRVLAELESIREGVRTGKLPDRICKTISCDRARECPMKNQCFDQKP